MEGKVYMSQEQIIKVHLEKNEKKDYMVFEFEDEKSICLNEDECQNDLKEVFSILLKTLIVNPIKLVYKENSEYNVGLYIDVCKEYIKDLNKEISSVRKRIPANLTEVNVENNV